MQTKTVYAYALDSGAFIGERTLDDTDRSPISGTWQIPGNMTETQPPAAKEGYDICWHGDKWEQVERPKPAPEPEPPKETGEVQEPYTDPERLAAFEAMAEQEARLIVYGERLAALETALKGGDSK
ncbi:hypothetical protein [Selenomonas felix]|uniref:hypothetical protein n=1 Tax=Selenomonas felix TaxID=1944634 RepID=UPI0020704416|nr:hypothetical protein [Selenomonas felix]DAY45603.1 MAG TPA: hypothetical protein [Caudoviricetes sp.]